ncbi:unnamed protein product, partial [Amoebophrya sp. A25]|eukprot:GSA25T00020375001.1
MLGAFLKNQREADSQKSGSIGGTQKIAGVRSWTIGKGGKLRAFTNNSTEGVKEAAGSANLLAVHSGGVVSSSSAASSSSCSSSRKRPPRPLGAVEKEGEASLLAPADLAIFMNSAT